jgi:hypothetical protein
MFAKFFGKKSLDRTEVGRGRAEAVTTLQMLDQAIMSIHPDRYVDQHDAAVELQPYLVNINTMLGRPATERFFPVEYDAVVDRMTSFANKGLLGRIVHAAKPLPVIHALTQGVLHEVRIRHNKDRHNEVNLGREVQCSTQTLIDFLNRAASSRHEPMPDGG